eukprot:275739_1
MSTHSKSFTISPFHQLFCQILDLVEGKSIIMDLHQFHTNSCILLPDGIHMAHEFNGIGRILRHILDFYPGYGYIESAGYGLFYEALWILLIFSLFMAFTYFFEDAAVRKSGTIKIQMVLALAKLYEIYNKYLEIGKDNRLRCATLSVSELLYYTNYINKIMNIYYSHKTLILNLTRKYYMMNNTKLLMNINNKIINKINKYYSRGLYYMMNNT